MVHLDVDPEIHYRFYEYAMCISRVRPRFFDQVGHETKYRDSPLSTVSISTVPGLVRFFRKFWKFFQ